MAARAVLGYPRRRRVCGGCGSACLLLLILGTVVLLLFWREVNATLRGIYPPWPFAFFVPIAAYAYSQARRIQRGPSTDSNSFAERMDALLRTHVDVRLGPHTIRLYLFCHGMPERSLSFRGRRFPVCARCTGLLVGIGLGAAVAGAVSLTVGGLLGLSSVLILPLLVDGFTQLLGPRESTNRLRLLTGIAAGIGMVLGAHPLRLLLVGT